MVPLALSFLCEWGKLDTPRPWNPIPLTRVWKAVAREVMPQVTWIQCPNNMSNKDATLALSPIDEFVGRPNHAWAGSEWNLNTSSHHITSHHIIEQEATCIGSLVNPSCMCAKIALATGPRLRRRRRCAWPSARRRSVSIVPQPHPPNNTAGHCLLIRCCY